MSKFQIRIYNKMVLIDTETRDLSVVKLVWNNKQQGCYPLTIGLRDEQIHTVSGLSLKEIGKISLKPNVKVLSSKMGGVFVYREVIKTNIEIGTPEELQNYLLSFERVRIKFNNRIND